VGFFLLQYQQRRWGKDEEKKGLREKYVVMALLDSIGTFLSAMGSVQTLGYLQVRSIEASVENK